MPLTMTKAGDTVTIRKITGKDEVRQHLAELGFVVGETVTVVNEISGNLILQVRKRASRWIRPWPCALSLRKKFGITAPRLFD